MYDRNFGIKYSFDECKICSSKILLLNKKTVDGLSLAKCTSCGLLFVRDIPFLQAEDDKKKTLNYYSHTATDVSKFTYSLNELTKHINERPLDERKGNPSNLRILDIGCGDGKFLSLCREHGFEVYGVELRESCVELCREKGLQNVFNKDISEIEEQFDLITLFDVAEHIESLKPFFNEIDRLLKKEGYLYIETPRQSVLDIYISILGAFSSIINNRVSREHVQLFSDESLRILLEETGFSIIKLEARNSLSWKDKKKYIRNLGVKSDFFIRIFEIISEIFIKLGILGNNKAIIIAKKK